jgi:hypothetical protein
MSPALRDAVKVVVAVFAAMVIALTVFVGWFLWIMKGNHAL